MLAAVHTPDPRAGDLHCSIPGPRWKLQAGLSLQGSCDEALLELRRDSSWEDASGQVHHDGKPAPDGSAGMGPEVLGRATADVRLLKKGPAKTSMTGGGAPEPGTRGTLAGWEGAIDGGGSGCQGLLLGGDHGCEAGQLGEGSSIAGKLSRGQGRGSAGPDGRAGCIAAIAIAIAVGPRRAIAVGLCAVAPVYAREWVGQVGPDGGQSSRRICHAGGRGRAGRLQWQRSRPWGCCWAQGAGGWGCSGTSRAWGRQGRGQQGVGGRGQLWAAAGGGGQGGVPALGSPHASRHQGPCTWPALGVACWANPHIVVARPERARVVVAHVAVPQVALPHIDVPGIPVARVVGACVVDAHIVIADVADARVVVARVQVARVEVAPFAIAHIARACVVVADIPVALVAVPTISIAYRH